MSCSVFRLAIFCSFFVVASCKKNDPEPPAQQTRSSQGVFTTTINNTAWNPQEYKAVYYPQLQELRFRASDEVYSSNFRSLRVGMIADTANMLRSYPFEFCGTNEAFLLSYSSGSAIYSTDKNIADAGGYFQLTKFDTITGKMSGVLNFTAYSGDQQNKIVLASTKIEDIKLEVDRSYVYDGSYTNAQVTGVRATNWSTKHTFGMVHCYTNYSPGFPGHKILTIYITSLLSDNYPSYDGRALLIRYPLDNGVGTFQTYPDVPPYSYCYDMYLNRYTTMEMYFPSFNQNRYNPTSGTFQVIALDTANRKLTGRVNVVLKHPTRNDSIRISNAVVRLEKWTEL